MSTDLATATNHQIRLAARPVGLPKDSDWSFTEEPVILPADGGVLVRSTHLSLDPAMRGWMNEGKSYIAPVGIGEVMRAGGVGVVVASKNPAFAVGDPVSATLGVQEYCLIPAAQIQRSGLVRIDTRLGSQTQWLNVLGMPGMTGYFGLMEVGQPRAGETVVVSGAAGVVGAASTASWAKAYSLMKRSTEPMATGSLLQLRMQAPSQRRSWGQTREQISGMLLVERERAAASRNWPWAASASHSGMRFERGQAWAQRALGHWMQRLACSRTVASS